MTDNTNALVPVENRIVAPVATIEELLAARAAVKSLFERAMIKGHDYGTIPGTGDKPTLLLPGAQKLCTTFGIRPVYELIEKAEDWTGAQHDGEPFFYYYYRCRLYRHADLLGEGDGSCNSWEKKYRYRAAERVCPNCGQANIRKSKKGDGWYCWTKTGGCGAQFPAGDPTIEGQETGQVANPDIFDQVNTLQKMAQKRAYIQATLYTTNASEFFTQDLEDLYGDVIEGEVIEHPSGNAPQTRKNGPKSRGTQEGHASAHVEGQQTQNGARWNEDKARVKKFADWYQHSQGLTHADALAALGVDKISAFQGTDAEAVAAIEAYVAEQLNTPPAAPAGAQAQPALLPDDAPPAQSTDAAAIAA